MKTGQSVGVVGFGGLGDMAIKLAKALGAEVTVFTTTKGKLKESSRLGVQGVLENDKDALKAISGPKRISSAADRLTAYTYP